jgi:hypothetical protein
MSENTTRPRRDALNFQAVFTSRKAPTPLLPKTYLDNRRSSAYNCIMRPSLLFFRTTFLSALFLFNLLTLTSALSWYDKGHRIVGLIAQANLTGEARKQIETILPGSMTLADAAIWPDHEGRSIRDFDPLHYVSIPEYATGYDQRRDCPERNCMVEALKWFSSVIAIRTRRS